MKRALLVVLAAAFTASGCATAGRLVPQIEVDSPLARQVAGNSVVYGQSMSIINTLDAYCALAVGSKEVAFLAPGQIAYDVRRFEPLYPAIPVAARCYADATKQEYLGAAVHIFYLSYYGALTWEITLGEMRWSQVGVSWAANSPSVPPSGNPTSIKVKFPREAWNATALVQVVNNVSGATGYATVDGRPIGGRMELGDLLFSGNRLISGWGQQRALTLRFIDGQGRFIGAYTTYFWVPNQGIQAYQFVVGPNDLRR